MRERNQTLDTLNNILQGEYMAIEGYNIFINYLDDQNVKKEFQQIQQEHRKHASILAEHIQNLNDMPREKTGLKGAMADTMLNMDIKAHTDTYYIIRKAYEGENKGINMAEEVAKGDLDSESRRIVGKILSQDRKHLEKMKKLMNE